MTLTIGERKAAVFLRAVAALEDLKQELQAEIDVAPPSAAIGRHVQWVHRIEQLVEDLLTDAAQTR